MMLNTEPWWWTYGMTHASQCSFTVGVHGTRYRAALIGIEWKRFAAYWGKNRLCCLQKVGHSLTLCKWERFAACWEPISSACVCDLEANVAHRGGSNQKYRNKMAESRDSVTGKYFMWIKVIYTTFYMSNRLGLLFICYTNAVRSNRIL